MMSGDRKSERIANITVDDDVNKYFKSLVDPLKKSVDGFEVKIVDMFKTFSADVISKLEKRLDMQEAIITEQNKKIELLESSLSLRQNTVEKLIEQVELHADNNEQYSRRKCIRINNLEYDENVREDIGEVLKGCYDAMKLPFKPKRLIVRIVSVSRILTRRRIKYRNR